MKKNMFPLEVVCTEGILFQEDVESVYLYGAEGEFELLPYHYPLVAALTPGEINIAGKSSLPIKSGIVMFEDNRCTIIAEIDAKSSLQVKGWL